MSMRSIAGFMRLAPIVLAEPPGNLLVLSIWDPSDRAKTVTNTALTSLFSSVTRSRLVEIAWCIEHVDLGRENGNTPRLPNV